MKSLTRVEFSNLEKVLYPAIGVAKGQVIEYYIRVAPRMLDFLMGRVAVMNRFPDGVDRKGFYEKDAPAGTPSWVDTFARYSESSHREIRYVVCNNLDTLLWLANLSALELHITLSSAESFERPNLVLFDLDPEPPAGFNEAIQVALLLKEKLEALGFVSYVKTTGKKGLHVVLPVVTEYSYPQSRAFVHQVGKYLAAESSLVVSEASQSREAGKVYIDYPQNSSWKTMASPYSLRAERDATVSTPVEWHELEEGIRPETFNIYTVAKSKKDPWKGLLDQRQRLEMKWDDES